MREGATIPVVSQVQSMLGLDAVMIGYGQPDDCIHSNDEERNPRCLERARLTDAVLLHEPGMRSTRR